MKARELYIYIYIFRISEMFKKRKSSYEDSCGVLREKEKERFKNIKYIIHPDRKLVILRALNFLIIKISSTHSKKILKLHEPISIYHLLSRILLTSRESLSFLRIISDRAKHYPFETTLVETIVRGNSVSHV